VIESSPEPATPCICWGGGGEKRQFIADVGSRGGLTPLAVRGLSREGSDRLVKGKGVDLTIPNICLT